MSKGRRTISTALRVAVSLSLIAYMVSQLDGASMLRYIRRADPFLVALTLVAVLLDRVLMVARWTKLVEALDVYVPRVRIFKIFFLSTFFGSFLPSGVGGEAVRAASFSRLTNKALESVASVVMDRVLGLLSMLLTGLLSLTVFYRLYPSPVLLAAVFVCALAVAVGLALALARPVHALVLERYRGSWPGRVAEAMGRYRNRLGTLGAVLVLSVGVQLLRVLHAYLLSEALRLDTPFKYFLCFVPAILVVTMLPISIGGWGTTNASYVYLFSQVGMDPEGAFVLSVLILALGIVGNLPGGLIYAWEGFGSSRKEAT